MQVYGRRNSTNVVPVLWALEEIGMPYRRRDVGGSFGGVDEPWFRALNPNGRIPVIDDGGFVLWESNAIVRYLAERYGEGTLRPPTDRERARGDQWMEWYRSTFYPPFIALFQTFARTEPAARDAARIGALAETVADLLRIPDAGLRGDEFLGGGRFGPGDIPLGAALFRYASLPVRKPSLEGIERWYAGLCGRPAYRSCAMRPFGLTPSEFAALEQAGAGR